MRAIIQRVTSSSVSISGRIEGEISTGYLVLLGITHDDTIEDVSYISRKIIGLRIFSDRDNKMNLSIKDIQGSILLISQFTLYASTKKGNRPSFIKAAKSDIAIPLYESMITSLRIDHDIHVETGIFGADMSVTLINDGPVTILLDSKSPF